MFLSDPDAVKQVFTGDPRLLHAGEANVVLLPVLGSHSVLLLDDDAHMAQRKLMLPLVPRRADAGLRGDDGRRGRARDRALAGRRAAARVADHAGDHARGDHADGLRRPRQRAGWSGSATAFGAASRSPPQPRRMAHPRRCSARAASRSSGSMRSVLEPTDELIYEEIRSRRDAPDLAERDDVLSLLLQARHDDGTEMTRQGAPRRADDAARGRARDQRHGARLGARRAHAPSRACSSRLRDEIDAGDDTYLDAVVKETLRLRPVIALVLRRLIEPMEIGGRLLPARRDRRAVHLPAAPPRRRLRRAARLPPRALPREAAGHLHLDPVRRRRAPLPRRELRPVRDEGRAARAGRAARHPRRARRARSAASAERSCSRRRAEARSSWSGARAARRRSPPSTRTSCPTASRTPARRPPRPPST